MRGTDAGGGSVGRGGRGGAQRSDHGRRATAAVLRGECHGGGTVRGCGHRRRPRGRRLQLHPYRASGGGGQLNSCHPERVRCRLRCQLRLRCWCAVWLCIADGTCESGQALVSNVHTRGASESSGEIQRREECALGGAQLALRGAVHRRSIMALLGRRRSGRGCGAWVGRGGWGAKRRWRRRRRRRRAEEHGHKGAVQRGARLTCRLYTHGRGGREREGHHGVSPPFLLTRIVVQSETQKCLAALGFGSVCRSSAHALKGEPGALGASFALRDAMIGIPEHDARRCGPCRHAPAPCVAPAANGLARRGTR